jgi:hypothetical protein
MFRELFAPVWTSTVKKIFYKKTVTTHADGTRTEQRILQHGEGDANADTEAEVGKMEKKAESAMEKMDDIFAKFDEVFKDLL